MDFYYYQIIIIALVKFSHPIKGTIWHILEINMEENAPPPSPPGWIEVRMKGPSIANAGGYIRTWSGHVN